MTDLQKFQNLFSEIGIKYEMNGDVLYVDSYEVDGFEIELLVIKFYDDGSFQEFSAYPVQPNFINPEWRDPKKLKPCPFCGGEAYHHVDDYNINVDTAEDKIKTMHFIMCKECSALVCGETEEIARKNWNRRVKVN